MAAIQLNEKYLGDFISQHEVDVMQPFVNVAHEGIQNRSAVGSEFLGWVSVKNVVPADELERLAKAAERIRNQADVLIVIGIGGSYLGTRAVEELLNPVFAKGDLEIIYAGQTISGRYLEELLAYIDGKSVAVNVISKSGTTTEPAIAFRIIRQWMETAYGSEAAERIYVTTDEKSGALRKVADDQGYESFVIPDDIGGRYSVLTPVGLLPLAAAGIDIHALLDGAEAAEKDTESTDLNENTAYKYAVSRQVLSAKGYSVEVLASFEPTVASLNEWWKQLFGESEGKDGKGIYPSSVVYSTDLHSLGQYMQSGRRFLFETLISFGWDREGQTIPSDEENGDQLNYLSGKTLDEVNSKVFEAAALAHRDGGVPVLSLEVEKLDAYHVGYVLHFFMKACAMSAYLSGVNPFDQPGVEQYKQNMFRLLGKPGYTAE